MMCVSSFFGSVSLRVAGKDFLHSAYARTCQYQLEEACRSRSFCHRALSESWNLWADCRFPWRRHGFDLEQLCSSRLRRSALVVRWTLMCMNGACTDNAAMRGIGLTRWASMVALSMSRDKM